MSDFFSKQDLRHLERLAEQYDAAFSEYEEQWWHMVEIAGWDFTSNDEPPSDAKYIGCLDAIIAVDRGPLASSIRENLFTSEQRAIARGNQTLEADKKSDHRLWGQGAARHPLSDYKTLKYQARWWEHRFLSDCKVPYELERPLAPEMAEEFKACNRRVIYAKHEFEAALEVTERILTPYIFQSKEGCAAVKSWLDSHTPIFSLSDLLRRVEDYFNKVFTATAEDVDDFAVCRTMTNEEFAEVRDKQILATRLVVPLPVGTSGLEPRDVPAGTYLQDQRCGCIVRRMSRKEVTAMDLRRTKGTNLAAALSDTYPYFRKIAPGPCCLQKIRLRRYRYVLGTHNTPLGRAEWSYDKCFKVVDKPPKFRHEATASSHPDLPVYSRA